MNNAHVKVTTHAIIRARERLIVDGMLTDDQVRSVIVSMVRSSTQFGAQKGSDFYLRATAERTGVDFVFACKRDQFGRVVIKTVLTVEQATVNMQSRGLMGGRR